MPKMKFSQLLEMLHEAGSFSTRSVTKGSPEIGLKHVGLLIPDDSPFMAVATEFRDYHLNNKKDQQVLIMITERARECWSGSINGVNYLEESVYKKWLEKKSGITKELANSSCD